MRHPISNLQPATDYEAVVLVENKFGWSEESDAFRFNTRKGNFLNNHFFFFFKKVL